MNTSQNLNEDEQPDDDGASHRRHLGYWLRGVDNLITREFASAFEAEGVTRRDWMRLNALSGDIDVPGLAERITERIARKPHRLRDLADRGWVAQQDGTWVITDEGRAARARLSEVVAGIRTRVAGAVSPEDFATTLASLEAIARELGDDEPLPLGGRGRRFGHGGHGRGFGHGRGQSQGHGHGRGFDRSHAHGIDHERGNGHEHGFGPGHGHSPCEGPHGHHDHDHDHNHNHNHRGHGHGGRGGERAYERGFDAGFSRGQAGSGSSDAA